MQWFTLLYQGVRGASPDAPLPVAVVEREEQEGLRVDATIAECEPSAIACDDALELTWTGTEDAPSPRSDPVADGRSHAGAGIRGIIGRLAPPRARAAATPKEDHVREEALGKLW